MKIHQETYPGLMVVAVTAVFDSPLGELETPAEIFDMLDTQQARVRVLDQSRFGKTSGHDQSLR